MIEQAGYGIAMANGEEEIKQKAKFVTAHPWEPSKYKLK